MRFTMNANRPMNSHDWNLVHAGPAACPVQRPKHRSVVRGASMLNSVCVATQVGDIYLSSRSSEPRSLRPWLNASLNLHIGHAQADYSSRFPEAHGHVDGQLAVSWSRNPPPHPSIPRISLVQTSLDQHTTVHILQGPTPRRPPRCSPRVQLRDDLPPGVPIPDHDPCPFGHPSMPNSLTFDMDSAQGSRSFCR